MADARNDERTELDTHGCALPKSKAVLPDTVRRSYEPPRLMHLGSVRALTWASGGVAGDGGLGQGG
jgi:hypothetical protein